MTTPTPEQTLVIRRVFSASRERVYRAWTEANALQQWFKPMGCKVTVSRMELRVGGAYQFDLEHPDGATSSINGQYIDIIPSERLVFTWISGGTHYKETRVTVEFFERGAETEVQLTHAHLTDESMLQSHQNGWACIEFLADAL